MLRYAVVKRQIGHPSIGRVSFDNCQLSNELSNTNPRSIGRSTIQLSNTNLFARHVLYLGGENSLRAVMSGTARLGQGVHREVESEGS